MVLITEEEYERFKKCDEEYQELLHKVDLLSGQIARLNHQLYGRKSEKNVDTVPLPSLFDELLSEEEKKQVEEDAKLIIEENDAPVIIIKEHTRQANRKNNAIDTSNLRVEVKIIKPENIDFTKYKQLGEEISDELIFQPAEIYIKRTIRPKYVLKSSLQIENPNDKAFVIAPLKINRPLGKSIASSSILSHIFLQKFMYHLPYYRIIQQFKELGFKISDSTINDWYIATCSKLEPLYKALQKQVLLSDYIQVDESTVPVIDNEKKKTVKGYIWVVRDAISGNIFFIYKKGSRSYATALELLGDYEGAIQTDGYGAYDQFEDDPKKVLLSCLAHSRRKFFESLAENKYIASEGIAIIAKLYAIEKLAKENELSPEEKQKLREKEATPIFDLLERWIADNLPKTHKSSRIGKALSYTYSILPRLKRYILDGRYHIDSNLVEGAIRVLAIGRKNWMFCGNGDSAERASMMYSFISSCKAAEVDPRVWLTYVLDNLDKYEDINALLPKNFKSIIED